MDLHLFIRIAELKGNSWLSKAGVFAHRRWGRKYYISHKYGVGEYELQ